MSLLWLFVVLVYSNMMMITLMVEKEAQTIVSQIGFLFQCSLYHFSVSNSQSPFPDYMNSTINSMMTAYMCGAEVNMLQFDEKNWPLCAFCQLTSIWLENTFKCHLRCCLMEIIVKWYASLSQTCRSADLSRKFLALLQCRIFFFLARSKLFAM